MGKAQLGACPACATKEACVALQKVPGTFVLVEVHDEALVSW